MPDETPTSPPPAPEPTPFDPTDPNRFRLTPEEKARVLGKARQVIALQGIEPHPIAPTPHAE